MAWRRITRSGRRQLETEGRSLLDLIEDNGPISLAIRTLTVSVFVVSLRTGGNVLCFQWHVACVQNAQNENADEDATSDREYRSQSFCAIGQDVYEATWRSDIGKLTMASSAALGT